MYGQPGTPGMPSPGERKLSVSALMSLICGIVGCVPFITSLLAVILGIVGIKKTSDPRYSGRGLAIAGLILGLLGLAGWGLFGGGIFAMMAGSKPAANVAQQFTSDIAAGNVSAAQARCESTVTQEQLQSLADQFKSWGAFKDLTIPARAVDKQNGQTIWTLTGVASFNSGAKTATYTIRKQSDGSYKITSADFK
jgi:hypothetical protein